MSYTAAFALEYMIRLYLAPATLPFMRSIIDDLLIVDPHRGHLALMVTCVGSRSGRASPTRADDRDTLDPLSMTGVPMGEDLQPTVVRSHQRQQHPAVQTAGVLREQAFSSEDVWVGVVTTEPGDMSAWHHHGDHDTYAYVVSGLKRIEYGPGGARFVIAGPDEFIHVPRGLIHREGNPSSDRSRSIAFRLGIGPATVNVEGPLSEPDS